MPTTSSYWQERINKEKAWQKAVEKEQEAYNKQIAQLYQRALDKINNQIKADLVLADSHLITAKGMSEYETLAKEAVDKANRLRAAGHHVSRKDFSQDVNDRLKVYNATMRINRNEMLKSKIGAELTSLGIEQEDSLTNKLWSDYTKEKKRQAGILGITAQSNLWTSKEVQGQIYGQIANANFSKRIWANMDNLKAQLDGVISTGIIRGENPTKMARYIVNQVSDKFSNARYAAERLARTETSRVQFMAQKRSITDNGYKYVEWIAEAQACKVCREIADQDSDEGRGIYKVRDVPDIPVHPNCMCSIAAYYPDDKKGSLNIDKESDVVKIKDVRSFNQAIKKLGFTSVKGMNGVNADNLKIIYKTVYDTFDEHPELKGYLTKLQGHVQKKNSAVAWVSTGAKVNSKGHYCADVSLHINKPYLDGFDKVVARCVKDNWWTKKSGYSGVMKHELAHAIDGRAMFEQSPFDYSDINEKYNFSEFWNNDFYNHKFAEDVINETLNTVGVDLAKTPRVERPEVIGKYISKYPASYQKLGSQYAEAFAELYSDEDKSRPVKMAFDEILAKKMKEIYGDKQ